MSILGNLVVAALFDDRSKAEEAWGLLVDEGVPASLITDPGLLGGYELSVMVERDDLERVQELLAPLFSPPPDR